MITVVYPGSFDPVTVGHMDLIRRAAGIFDHVVVGVLVNSEKKSPLFSLEERVIMLKDTCKDLKNVSVESFDGLLIDFVRAKGSNTIIRGLRELMDFEMELQMAQVNRVASAGRTGDQTGEKSNGSRTLGTDPRYSNVSSSVVREYAQYGVALPDFVPDTVLTAMREKGYVK